MGEEKSALFGVKGRKAEEENSCSFQKMPLGNPPATGKEDPFAQVYVGGNTNQAALSEGPDLQMLWEKLPKGGKSPVPLAEPLQRMRKALLLL